MLLISKISQLSKIILSFCFICHWIFWTFLETDLPQSVVYQNEEGRWVTDLAYYTSFNKEQVLNMSLTDEMNEDFRSGCKCTDNHFIVSFSLFLMVF